MRKLSSLIFIIFAIIGCNKVIAIELKANEILIKKMNVPPGYNEDFVIKTKKTIWVGFRAITPSEKWDINDHTLIIKSIDNHAKYIQSAIGGATVFGPVDGKVKIKVQSLTKYKFDTIIYWKEIE